MFWQGSEYTSGLVFLPSILCNTFFDLSLQEDEAVSVTLKQFSLQLDLQKSFCAKQWKKVTFCYLNAPSSQFWCGVRCHWHDIQSKIHTQHTMYFIDLGILH